MTSGNAGEPRRLEGGDIRFYARLAGALGLVSMVVGAFGEGYVPAAMVVSGDAAATAANILGRETLFRWGFAGYMVEAICDATLTMLFWVLLRPVHRNLAMLMVVFRLCSTIGFAVAQVFYFGALPVLRGTTQLGAFTQPQLEALAFTLLKVGSFGGSLFSMFYGLAGVVMGVLLFRSGFLPRALGVLVALMGVSFTTHQFLLVLAPAYASPLMLFAAAAALLPLMLWLTVKGVDAARWRERALAAG